MPHTIVIIGGGFSGTLTAVHLLRGEGMGGVHVVLVNRSGPPGPGVAYGTRSPVHLLNVPAARMSAFPDDGEHFVRFARGRDPSVGPGDFVPRLLYGEYLAGTLEEARVASPAGARLAQLAADAVDVRLHPEGGARVALRGHAPLHADRVVLAAGSYPPADPPVPDAAFFASDPRYVRDPWAPAALDRVDRGRPALLLGTGLTMLDVALELHGRGMEAPMVALSRRGLLPRSHRSPAAPPRPVAPDAVVPPGSRTVRAYLRSLRACVEASPALDWRDIVAALRPVTPALWAALPYAERARFLRHLQPYWDVHRHRAAPGTHAAAGELIRTGALRVLAGRVLRMHGGTDGVDVSFRGRGRRRVKEVRVGTVINCTGVSTNVSALGEPLLDSLASQGLLVADPLGLGIRTAPNYALLDREGKASDVLFHVGPLLKADLWEATAVPELRVHAARLAAHLVRAVPARVACSRPSPA